MDVAWCATKYQIWFLQTMTQLRARNAGPQNKIQNTNDQCNKIQIGDTKLFPMGIYKKSTAQSSNTLMAVMQTKGP